MRDPYLYDDVDVLKNRANIKDFNLLRRAEADITNIAMTAIYDKKFDRFDLDTLCEIHKLIFGQIYEWAGDFRTIQMEKYEEVLAGASVDYSYPKDIKKELIEVIKEIPKLKRDGKNDKDIVFRLVRIISRIWHIHPFREGNTRCAIIFAVLLAKHLGFTVNHELFKDNSAYVRNAFVWCTLGIYSKYEYLENIFYDAILGESEPEEVIENKNSKYEMIGDYKVKDYKERPHTYKK